MSKAQSHLAGLWHLLEQGQANLQTEFDRAASAGEQAATPAYTARRVLTRTLMSAQKHVHKSLHCLLGYPEAYCSHNFCVLSHLLLLSVRL